jgi:hypothetical protein
MAALAGYKASVYVSNTGTSSATTNEAMTNVANNQVFQVTSNAHRYLDPTVVPVVQSELNEVQTVTITGTPTGGTFVLRWGGNNTSALNWNATAAQMQTALQALAGIGAGNALVTGGPGPGTAFQVEFTSALGFASQAVITLQTNSLTGGTSPNVSIAEVQAGQGWTTITAYALGYCGGIVNLNVVALTTGVNVRLSTANYLTVSQAIQAKSVEFNTQIDLADITTFASAQTNNGFRSKLALLGDASVKLSQWWIDGFYFTNLNNLLVVVAYSGKNSNQQLACYAYLKTDGLKFDPKAVEEESLDFESHGPVLYVQS